MNKVSNILQTMMQPKKEEMYNDRRMLKHSIQAIRAMADEIEKELDCGCEMPSWVEYKIYKACDALKSVIGHIMSIRGRKTNARVTIIGMGKGSLNE
tara:strand:+ start:125 stop:415 length:291 start_codon:yes stop_codon:yes gene_type:complete